MRITKDFLVVKKPRTECEELGDFDTYAEAVEYKEMLEKEYTEEGWDTELGILVNLENWSVVPRRKGDD